MGEFHELNTVAILRNDSFAVWAPFSLFSAKPGHAHARVRAFPRTAPGRKPRRVQVRVRASRAKPGRIQVRVRVFIWVGL